jgi:hypothetical protein
MTAVELVSQIRARFLESSIDPREAMLLLRLVLNDMADNLYQVRLADRQSLLDQTDFSAFLREMVAAIEHRELLTTVPVNTADSPLRSTGRARICYSCGHPHPSGQPCEVEMGGAGRCGCVAKVPA